MKTNVLLATVLGAVSAIVPHTVVLGAVSEVVPLTGEASSNFFAFEASFSSSNTARNISGNYNTALTNSEPWLNVSNNYNSTVAVDAKGKVLVSGTVSGVVTTNGGPMMASGTMKSIKGVPSTQFRSSLKNLIVLGTDNPGLPANPAIANGNANATFQYPANYPADLAGMSTGNATGNFLGFTNKRANYSSAKRSNNLSNVEFPTNNSAGAVPWSFSFYVYTNHHDGKTYATDGQLKFANFNTNTGSVDETVTKFAETRATYSQKTGGWTANFTKPTNGDTLARMGVKDISPTNISAGSVSYKFLGQSGSGPASQFNPVY